MSKSTRLIMLCEDGRLFFGGRMYGEEQLEQVKQHCRDGLLSFGETPYGDNNIKVDAIYPYRLSGMCGMLVKPIAERVAK